MGFGIGCEGWPWFGLVNCARDSSFVNDCNTGRRLKVKLRFWEGNVLLPVAKAEFGFDISRLTEHHANEPGLRVLLKENFTQRICRISGVACAVSWRAA